VKKLEDQVRTFMEAAGQRVGQEPGDISEEMVELGILLIREEFKELGEAILKGYPTKDLNSLAEIADAIGDLLYVVTWAGLAWGFPMPEIMDEIQRANMAKFGPGSSKDENGKVQKPPGWTPPDIAGILARFRGSR
jgi:predicted HAD superfamily Cof-like phosphohydrolase